MKIAVISDLHLGPGDDTDRFGHDDDRFLTFLAYLEDNFEKIVLLGDVWETLTGPLPMNPKAALRKAREAHGRIARRFEGSRYSYVHGNHDLVAGVADGVPEELSLDVDGSRILFTHGHHHDLLIQKARWLSELGVWMGAWILRLRMSWLYRVFDQFDRFRSGMTPDSTRCTFQRWAVSLAQVREADIVVTGHTHIPMRAEHGNKLYLNSGSCSQGNYSFLALDTGAGVYGVHGTF